MGKIPQRMCIACREMKDKRALIRCVLVSDNTIELDKTGKKNGRGAYICADINCISKAKKHNLLEKSLGVQPSDSIYDQLSNEQN